MTFNALSVVVLLFGALSSVVAGYAWRHRTTVGAQAFAGFLAAVTVYIIGYSLELASGDLPTILFWSKVEYVGILMFPAFYLMFAMQFTGRGRWLRLRNVALLFVIPLLVFAAKVVDERFHLIYASAAVDASGPLPLLVFTRGPLYLPLALYNLAVVTVANVWLVQKRSHASALYRRQTTLILVAAAIMYIIYLYYLSDFRLIPSLRALDLNPFAYALWGAVVAVAIFRYGLFELAPIARDALIERLGDGVVVLDPQLRLVDANPAALGIFGWAQPPVGQPAEAVMPRWFDQASLREPDRQTRLEAELGGADGGRTYEVTISPLREKRGQPLGYLTVVHDISARKAVERELHELSLMDELTGLTNRRGFNMLATQLLGVSRRMHLDAALFFLDLDGLKGINDRFGHAAGDQALKDTAQLLKSIFRSSDVVARLGGDEFVVLAAETPEASGQPLLDRLQEQRREFVTRAGRGYELSFSIGQARDDWTHPRSLDALLAEADQAMYAAKQAAQGGDVH
jgi:diguanylate cyclase (GGDEF)-like protein/PAS domain S-box-containing protein